MKKRNPKGQPVLEYIKVRDVKAPQYGTPGSGGLDFYIPNDIDFQHKTLAHSDSILIPSGIVFNLQENWHLLAINKSGAAIKGLQVGACFVDSDYQGEVHLHVINIGREDVTIYAGQKLVQFLPIYIEQAVLFRESSKKRLFRQKKTRRGNKGFGSTG